MSSAVKSDQLKDQIYTEGQSRPGSQTAEADDADGERNMKLFRRIIEEGFNKGDLTVVDELISPDFKEHQFVGPDSPNMLEGPDVVKKVIRDCRNLFPDFTITIQEMVAVGDKVWARAIGGGIHGGDFMGRPPTGRNVSVLTLEVARFENGKMVEHWGVPDRFHMLAQLGMIPGRPDVAR